MRFVRDAVSKRRDFEINRKQIKEKTIAAITVVLILCTRRTLCIRSLARSRHAR
jgi:hypothetical protein